MPPINNMFVIPGMKISDIIINNPYLMLMLEHFGIPLEVREKTVGQICAENHVNAELFISVANLFNGFKPLPKTKYSFKDTKTIINYLQNSHQYYLNEKYPQIQYFIKEIYKINSHPEILMIEKFFDKYFMEVTEHLDYENQVVFPYVLSLDKQQSTDKNATGNYSVTEYREHHNDIEDKLNDLKNLLIKYLPLNKDQQLRRKLLFCLFELEYDLNIHSQIEDNILIPLVEEMETIGGKENE